MGKFVSKKRKKGHDQGLAVERKFLTPAALFILLLGIAVLGSAFSFGSPASAGDFPDLRGHWAAGEIQKAVAQGYLKGYPDGTFKPDRAVTRAEFVALANAAFQIKSPQKPRVVFKDVEPGDWFARQVDAALASGYINGYPDGNFRPQKAVNRQEAACLLARLLKLEGNGNVNFADAGKIGNWARSAVFALVAKEIMTGYPDGTFRPTCFITRAEAAVMINRGREELETAPEEPGVTPEEPGVTPEEPEVTPVSVSLQVMEEVVNIRSGPGTNYSRLGQVRAGDILKAKAYSSNNWYQVGFQGRTGWIAGWLVQTHQTPPPSRDEPAALEVQVERQAGKLVVALSGKKETAYQWEEKANPQRLVVTVPGITVVRTPLEIDVEEAGLERIVTRFPAEAPGTAGVELLFGEYPVPVFYQIERGTQGELRVIIPYQIMQADALTEGEALLIELRGTAPLACRSFSLRGPKRLVFDFAGFILHPVLLGWEKEAGLPEIDRVRLGQFQPDVARLVVEINRGASFAAEPRSGGRELLLKIKAADLAGRRVALDPGHGGSDPGALGPGGVREKDVDLAIALQAAEILRQEGVEVFLTRNGDQEIDLVERAGLANSIPAEVFVSIHANATYNTAIGGTATYTYAPLNTPLGLQREARLYLAQALQEELVQALGLRDAGVHEANFAVLRYTRMPAALVEVAFLSNRAEERLLVNPEFQARAAAALARGIDCFLTE